MPLGQLKKVGNSSPKLNSSTEYGHIKVQPPCGEEEHWFITARERMRFKNRAAKNPVSKKIDVQCGRFFALENESPKPNAHASYHALVVQTDEGIEAWLLSDYDIERIRRRSPDYI